MTTSPEAREGREAGSAAVVGPVMQREVLPGMLARYSAKLVGGAVGAVWRSDSVVRARSVAAYRIRRAPRDLSRLSWFAIRGHARWIGKTWTFMTYGDLRADARAARIAGDPEARRAAQELIRADARARWTKLALFLHRAMGTALIGAALAIMLWMIDSSMSREQMWPWLAALYRVIDTGWSVLTTMVPILIALSPVGWLLAAIYEGRDKTPGAGWLVRPDRDDADSWIDERMISHPSPTWASPHSTDSSKTEESSSTPSRPDWTATAPSHKSGCPWA
jgi:hypothetical protein